MDSDLVLLYRRTQSFTLLFKKIENYLSAKLEKEPTEKESNLSLSPRSTLDTIPEHSPDEESSMKQFKQIPNSPEK